MTPPPMTAMAGTPASAEAARSRLSTTDRRATAASRRSAWVTISNASSAIEPELEFTPKFNGDSGKFKGVDTQTFGVWANFKGYPTAPWTGRFQPYLMTGIGWWWERRWGKQVAGVDEHGGFVSRFGGGIDFYITKNIVVTAESAWVLPTGELDKFEAGANRWGPAIPLRSMT